MFIKATALKPRGTHIVAEYVTESKSESGLLYVPNNDYLSPNIFKIVSVGPDVTTVKPGDQVVLSDKDYVSVTVNSNTEKLSDANVIVFKEDVIKATL